jgi:hypothetical protein
MVRTADPTSLEEYLLAAVEAVAILLRQIDTVPIAVAVALEPELRDRPECESLKLVVL